MSPAICRGRSSRAVGCRAPDEPEGFEQPRRAFAQRKPAGADDAQRLVFRAQGRTRREECEIERVVIDENALWRDAVRDV